MNKFHNLPKGERKILLQNVESLKREILIHERGIEFSQRNLEMGIAAKNKLVKQLSKLTSEYIGLDNEANIR